MLIAAKGIIDRICPNKHQLTVRCTSDPIRYYRESSRNFLAPVPVILGGET